MRSSTTRDRRSQGGGQAGLRDAIEQAWIATRGVATGALIPAGAGKVLLVAPRPSAGSFAAAARAGLENLARTLSVEWARFGVTTVALAPGAQTRDEELAELVSFLVSQAGQYFSGCLLELGVDSLLRTS
jgi:NAD(P)-dependent dehydrogenase (short-subunit alcohol dehydrogenase family)